MDEDSLALESLKTLEWRLTDAMIRLLLQYLWRRDEETTKQLVSLYFNIRTTLDQPEEH